jgi:type 1 glutamine amidotransferase
MRSIKTHLFAAVLACAVLFSSLTVHAGETLKVINALLVTGGCCHDYEAQKKILTEGISARANVTWTVVHEAKNEEKNHVFSVYEKPDWTKGFDVIVHNECSGKMTNVALIEKIVAAHTNGVPAVMIHCSIHSYREAPTDEWRKLLGVTSPAHQARKPFEVKNLKPEHPVMKGFPATWEPPNGELYEIEKVWPNCVPLAQAFGTRNQKDNVCIWVNTYGKARVFGTTIGHFNEEMNNPTFLDLVTRGLLWSINKLDDDGKAKPGWGKI